MKSPGKYIIIICDEPQRMEAARQLFEDAAVDAVISLAGNAGELTRLLQKRTPHAIVVHLVSDSERYVTYLRTDMAIDDVPILVYRILPGRADIERLLGRMGDDEVG